MADYSIQSQTVKTSPLESFNRMANDLAQYFMLKKQMAAQEKQQKVDNAIKTISTLASLYKSGAAGPELLSAAEPHFKTLGFEKTPEFKPPMNFKNMTKEQLIDMSQNHPDEDMRARAKSNLDTLLSLEDKTKPPSGVQEFELVTGTDPKLRGTPGYEKKYISWKKSVAESTAGVRIPSYQPIQDIPGMRFNRRTGAYEAAPMPEGETSAGMSEKKAATKSMANLQKQMDMTLQAEKQAVRNINIAKEYSDKYIRTKYPLPNQFIAAMRTQTGDPKVEQFKLALLAASREYMRVVTGGARSASELSIEAQKKADQLLNTSKSWEVFNAQTETMLQELGATKESFRNQIQEQKDILNPPKAKSMPKVLSNVKGAKGRDRYTDENGQVWDWNYQTNIWEPK